MRFCLKNAVAKVSLFCCSFSFSSGFENGTIRDCPTRGTRGRGVLKTPREGWGFRKILDFAGGFLESKTHAARGIFTEILNFSEFLQKLTHFCLDSLLLYTLAPIECVK